MSFLVTFLLQIIHKLETGLMENRNKVLSKYTIEDIINKPSDLSMIESYNEVVDQHISDLHVAGRQILRIALLLRP